ncbi:TPA: hypothetical protein ACIO89_004921 [Salmonella enterica subsp. enterica serovar Java]
MSDDDLNARRAAALAGDKCFSQSAKWRLNRSKFGIPADHDLAYYGSLSYDCSWIFSLRDDKYPDMGGSLFTGRYNFKKNHGELDVEAISLILESHVKQHFWKNKNT